MTTRGAEPRGQSFAGGSFADEAFAVAEAAYAKTPGSWDLAIQAAIAALFDFLARRPAETSACMGNGNGSTPEELERRDRTIDRFLELVRPGFAAGAEAPPPVVAEAIGGGIYELIRGHALESRLDALPDAAPYATFIALTPFQSTH